MFVIKKTLQTDPMEHELERAVHLTCNIKAFMQAATITHGVPNTNPIGTTGYLGI